MAAPRDPRIVLEQMLEVIGDIEQITTGRPYVGLDAHAILTQILRRKCADSAHGRLVRDQP